MLTFPRNSNVFPAHAGMSRVGHLDGAATEGFPRSRGDEPTQDRNSQGQVGFSPLTRG